jgi:UDP-glucose 4-epimerase
MRLRGVRVFVTGGAGFIGSHFVGDLVATGAQVTVFDNFSSGLMENLVPVKNDIRIVRGDILDGEQLRDAMRGHEIVSHQAAQLEITRSIGDPLFDLRTNTIGTLNVLRAAAETGVHKVVSASSAGVYGQAQHTPQNENHPTNPNWEYGVSKLAAEKYGQIYAHTHGFGVVSLRYAIVYGEREWFGRVLTIFLKRAHQGKPPVVFGRGDQVRDFVYVADVTRMHRLCLENERANNKVFNVSTGVGTNVTELANLVCEVTGKDLEPVFEEVLEGQRSRMVDGRMRLPSELQTMVMSYTRAKEELGWAPQVMLREGLRREWTWLCENPTRWTWMSY